MIPLVLPSSDIVITLTLGTPFACDDVYLPSILVNGDGGDDDSLCSIEMDADSICSELSCLTEVDGGSGGENSVDQQKKSNNQCNFGNFHFESFHAQISY